MCLPLSKQTRSYVWCSAPWSLSSCSDYNVRGQSLEIYVSRSHFGTTWPLTLRYNMTFDKTFNISISCQWIWDQDLPLAWEIWCACCSLPLCFPLGIAAKSVKKRKSNFNWLDHFVHCSLIFHFIYIGIGMYSRKGLFLK